MKRFYLYILFSLLIGSGLSACVGAGAPAPGDPTANSPDATSTGSPTGMDGGDQELPVRQSTAAADPTVTEGALATLTEEEKDLEIITLLPRDAIPAIFDPQFLTAEEADHEYDPDELVIGVVFDGEARAYSISHLSRHEIVNDSVAGRKIAVTW